MKCFRQLNVRSFQWPSLGVAGCTINHSAGDNMEKNTNLTTMLKLAVANNCMMSWIKMCYPVYQGAWSSMGAVDRHPLPLPNLVATEEDSGWTCFDCFILCLLLIFVFLSNWPSTSAGSHTRPPKVPNALKQVRQDLQTSTLLTHPPLA